MKMHQATILGTLLMMIVFPAISQNMKHPTIKNYGGIYAVPEATVLPDPDLQYKIVIDLYSGAEKPGELNPALNNVARMINLHAIGGAAKGMEVVLAIHGQANDIVMDNGSYVDRYGVDNPNIELIKDLKRAGVKLSVCGQSLLASKVAPSEVLREVEIATSMTTYQLKGFAFLAF